MKEFGDSDDRLVEQLAAFGMFEDVDRSSISSLGPIIRRMDLSALDCMTIRDLVDLGDCRGDVPLIVVLMAMFAGLQEGSLCLNLAGDSFITDLPADDRAAVRAVLADFLSGLEAGRYHKLVATDASTYMPLVLDKSTGERLLYFQKYHWHEQRLKDRIELLLTGSESGALPKDRVDALIEEIYADGAAIRAGRSDTPIKKDPVQLEAIRLALGSGFSIISGGPGTGKTSLMVNILRCLVREQIPVARIILGAPTGRAAQRMTETVQNYIASIHDPSDDDLALMGLSGSTLHKILGYRSYRNEFYFGRTNPLPASVVVIDEVSMVDIVMMDKFLQAVDPGRTRLILLGDQHQLPSVDAGSVLAEMIPDGARAAKFADRFVVLETVYRSGANLLELAKRANRGSFPPYRAVSFRKGLALEDDHWAFVNAQDRRHWLEHLSQWSEAYYLTPGAGMAESYAGMIARAGEIPPDELGTSPGGLTLLDRIFAVVNRARILSILRNGLYGCTVINDVIADNLVRATDPVVRRREDGFSGAMVIITRNDYAKDLFNGDVGVIIRGPDDNGRAFFYRSGAYISYPVNMLPSWELAFAITVHKSQGSEFEDVLLVLPDDENHRLLTREIVYTGITRARTRVLLYGTRPALNTALQKTINRQSGLAW